MKWQPGKRSRNLEDQRDGGGSVGPGPRSGGRRRRAGVPIALGGGGLVVFLVISVLVSMMEASGDQPRQERSQRPTKAKKSKGKYKGSAREEKLVDFMSFVLDDAQEVFKKKVKAQGKKYREAKLVIFDDKVRSGCGSQTSRVGPFYCARDMKAYLDVSFFRELSNMGGPGDFAQAYVVAHELAHHVQHITGIRDQVARAKTRNRGLKNELTMRMELQADCFAGTWAHSTRRRGILDKGDVKEGLDAAAAIGDDRLRKRAGRASDPETWTHGSSAMRVRWFKKGMRSGKMSDCDTFTPKRL